MIIHGIPCIYLPQIKYNAMEKNRVKKCHHFPFLLEISMSNKVPFSKSNDEAQERLLLEPFAYLMQFPGKDVRVKLLHAFNVWLQVDETKVREIGKCFYYVQFCL